MGSSINIQVTGYVGSDPQVRQVGEQSVASFSVAVSRKNRTGEKQTLWVRVNCWNKLADIAQQYVKKGSLVQASADWLRPSVDGSERHAAGESRHGRQPPCAARPR